MILVKDNGIVEISGSLALSRRTHWLLNKEVSKSHQWWVNRLRALASHKEPLRHRLRRAQASYNRRVAAFRLIFSSSPILA
jgi:predicted secreted protein